MVKLTVLGSGTSSGVPVINCSCRVCHSSNPKNKRWRSSCLIETRHKSILIDPTPDLRSQALRFKIKKIDAVFVTHTHADHILGLDELRIYNAHQKSAIPVYGYPSHLKHLSQMFSYIFKPNNDYPSLIPKFDLKPVTKDFKFSDISVKMIPCEHGDAGLVYNFRIGDVAWLTDTNGIPKSSYNKLKGLKYLFLDGLRQKKHPTHFSLQESLDAARLIDARKTYLIHLTHDYDHDRFNKTLPGKVKLAYDGLLVRA